MKPSQRKKIKRLIVASLMATATAWHGGLVYAGADFESSDNSSNNTITVNSDIYNVDGLKDSSNYSDSSDYSDSSNYSDSSDYGSDDSSNDDSEKIDYENNSSDSASAPPVSDLTSDKFFQQTDLLAISTTYPTLNLIGFMNDKLIDWLPPRSFDFEDEEDSENFSADMSKNNSNIFVSVGGGSFRNKIGDGSYINSTVKGFDIGFGRTLDYANGPLVFAPIFEYGTGDYDSYLADGTHGRGNTKYIAGGMIGRKSFKSGFYIEASARGGQTERDFSSDTMTISGAPVYTHYDKKSAPVFAGHLRIGKKLRLNKNNLLDVYGIYFHTHQGSMDLTLSTGEDYHFDSANAGKTRLGYRLTTRTSKISRIYTGLAFQYEHMSNAVGTYNGRRTPSSGNHGASGMLELGWMIRPNKSNPWLLDINATGWVGHQKGATAMAKIQKSF